MKILTTPGSADEPAKPKVVVTLTVRHATITGATLSKTRAEGTAVAGAVLAGVALSRTLFCSHLPRAGKDAVYAKLRV